MRYYINNSHIKWLNHTVVVPSNFIEDKERVHLARMVNAFIRDMIKNK